MSSGNVKKYKCRNPDCTVAETGRCLESHTDPGACPNCIICTDDDQDQDAIISSPVAGVAEKPARRFFSGFEIGLSEACELMSLKYTKLIGVIGASGVGKTCFLSSLYLMMSNGELCPDYFFAGSMTLPGFEDRARRVRKWSDGLLPGKLADHTSLQDNRAPAFLHLAIYCNKEFNKRHEFLFSDLPGEWTSDLIERNEKAGRFDFLKRADGLIYVLDGQALSDIELQNLEIHRAKLLLDRLANAVYVPKDIPFVVVISKYDLLKNCEPNSIHDIVSYANRLGFNPSVSLVSAFSSVPDVIKSGTGIEDVLERLMKFKNFETKKIVQRMHDFCRAYGRYLE